VWISPNFLGGLFQPPTLMGFALQSFVSFQVISTVLPPPYPLLRFLTKPLGLVSALQRLDPTRKAVPLGATRRISSGQGLMLSWAFRPLGLSRHRPRQEVIYTPHTPFSLFDSNCLTTTRTVNPKVSLSATWLSPSEEGAGPSGLFHRLPSPTP